MLFDKDEDGVINMDELGVMMKTLGQRPTGESRVDAVSQSVSQSGSQSVSLVVW